MLTIGLFLFTSDTSISSASALSKPMYYQDQLHPPPRETRAPASPDTRNNDYSDPGPATQFQQHAKDSSYLLPPHLDQYQHQHQHHHQQQHQQYIQAGAHYIHHPAASPVPMSPYYQVYPQTHQQFHHPIDQQYPVYVMPVAPQTPQPYNMPLQSNIADTTTVVASSPASGIPPAYPAKAASPTLPDMAASGVYNTTMASNAPLVQIPQNQFQQNYMGGFSQMHHHPSQSIAVPSSAAANYTYEYSNPPPTAAHEQVFYTQHPAAVAAAPLPSQYQSMTPAAAIALSEAAKQLPADNNSAQQPNRTS